jgi:tetratricopeptide (TPR) repeat protein
MLSHGSQYAPPAREWPAKAVENERSTMNTAAIKRLLTILSSKVGIERTRLYQLVDLAERCYCLKDAQGQRELGLLLQKFPPPFDLVGNYYEAIYLNQANLFDEARKRLERVYEHGPMLYRAKALLSLGAVEQRSGNLDEAMTLRLQASRVDIPNVAVEAQIGIASLLSACGDHRHAVKNLEQFLPLARMINRDTPLYYDYLNSFAVELNDAGRTEEARNVINLVLSTPYVNHYSNWIDTGKEVYRKSYRSSMVSAPKIRFERPDQELEHETETQPASVLSFPKLAEAPQPEKPQRVRAQELDDMTPVEKREMILAAVRSGAILDSEYDKMMFMLGLVKNGPAEKIIDLEDETVLTELIIDWAHLIEPEELAAVMSALRDCTDDYRRTNIMDSIIRKAFEYSRTCNITEAEWRLKVERRLPKK